MKVYILSACFVVIFLATSISSNHAPQVEIEQGVLVGQILESRRGRQFYSFTGIPYAKPPTGKRRFKAAVAPTPWKGILDASKPHAVCPQIDQFSENNEVIGDENCLFLNVYTPQLPKDDDQLLPIMFYIHGGWWTTGSANINYNGPKYLLDKNIVLVTVNYRLGPLGFFATGDSSVLGNNGLKDQLLALHWVKKNILKFGGNPASITLFGQSSGGASAHLHMLVPSSRKLIKGVISQSGSALSLSTVAPQVHVITNSRVLAGRVGCPTYGVTTKQMLECLRKLKASDIITNVDALKHWDIDPIVLFGPTVEPSLPNSFLNDDPIHIIKNGEAANIPLMIGLNTDEGGIRTADLFSKPAMIEQLNREFAKYGSMLLLLSKIAVVKHQAPSAIKVKEFYFGDKNVEHSTKSEFTKMYSDATILSGIDPTVELHTKFYKSPVYYYLFGYKGSASWSSLYDSSSNYEYGVCQGDELFYLFDSDKYPNFPPTESDEKVIDTMVTLWTNFATYGNPTPDQETSFVEKWEPVKRGQQNYYHIQNSTNMTLKAGLYTKRAQFWRNLPINSRQDMIRDEL